MSTLALPTNGSTPTPSHLNLALPIPHGSSSASPSLPNPALPSSNPLNGLNILDSTMTQNHASSSTPPIVKRQRSPSPELKDVEMDEEEGDDEDDDDGPGGGGRKKRSGRRKPAGQEGKGDYKYSSEIAQMMFVFGEVQDPSQETTRLVEDIVRGQVIEIVTRARLLTHLRSSRYLSAEDLIFLIRDDRGKVNRLRTYLSWKDVRKKAKEEEEGDLDVDEAEKAGPKGRKAMVKLPWELLTPFGDFLRGIPSKQGRNEEEDEEDEDEVQAYHDSMQRLKDADEITKKMTKDEYVHYSDCRQASFTYRKGRRFRDFVNFGAYLDVKPNDDIVDILGFLSFEMVRSLCVTALGVRDRLERPLISTQSTRKQTQQPTTQPTTGRFTSPKRKSTNLPDLSPNKKTKSEPAGTTVTIVASPEPVTPHHTGNTVDPTTNPISNTGRKGTNATLTGKTNKDPVSLFASPPSARQPLLPSHVLEAFAQIQREQAANRTKGLGNWRGASLGRVRIALV